MKNETKMRVEKAKLLISKGTPVQEALKKAHISGVTYYKHKRGVKVAKPKVIKRSVEPVTFQLPEPKDQELLIIRGDASRVIEALQRLAQIQ